MEIKYITIKLSLAFEEKFSMNIPFVYVFRSVLGKELKYLSCVLKQQVCSSCSLRFKCAYSVLFENPIDKENKCLSGRDKAPSPYVIQIDKYNQNEIDVVNMSVIFIGTGIDYISYFLLAVKRAGKYGMFRERVKYEVVYIANDNMEYKIDDDLSNVKIETFMFNDNMEHTQHKEIGIEFITPFRYKKDGRYTFNVTINDVLLSAKRRADMLSSFYGNGDMTPKITFIDKYEEYKKLSWVDSSRYSRRQDVSMKIGGIVGNMAIKSYFSDHHLSLLKVAELFNIGKNVSFGLGHIAISGL